jgi:hypothetical protein
VGRAGRSLNRGSEHSRGCWRGFAWHVLANQTDRNPTLGQSYSCSQANQPCADYDYVAGQGVGASRFLS